jgi:flavin prenyltransferase
MARLIVGISGASGIVLAHRLVAALAQHGHFVEFMMTKDAGLTAYEEMGEAFASPVKFIKTFSIETQKHIRLHNIQDFGSPIASGSFLTDGMIVIPCSMTTLSAMSIGLSDNLLRRAADVTLKEKRRLVIVPREAPLSEIHLENMLRLARMGAMIIPPQPAWYTKPKTLEDVENHIVGRTLDALQIYTSYSRWEGLQVQKNEFERIN